MSLSLSVIIPIYNSKNTIVSTVERLVDVLNEAHLSYEIVLRDDASRDGSQEVLKDVSLKYPQVKCFSNATNQGLGATLRQLFEKAKGEYLIYTDCDLPFGADIFPFLFKKAQYHDIVVLSRYRGLANHVRFIRKIFSRIYFFLCWLLFRIPVIDIGSGTVSIRKNILERLDLKAQGFDIHLELFLRAKEQGLSIEEIPAQADKHSSPGSFKLLQHGPRIAASTLKLWFDYLSRKCFASQKKRQDKKID